MVSASAAPPLMHVDGDAAERPPSDAEDAFLDSFFKFQARLHLSCTLRVHHATSQRKPCFGCASFLPLAFPIHLTNLVK
jgi:hypothetical protein